MVCAVLPIKCPLVLLFFIRAVGFFTEIFVMILLSLFHVTQFSFTSHSAHSYSLSAAPYLSRPAAWSKNVLSCLLRLSDAVLSRNIHSFPAEIDSDGWPRTSLTILTPLAMRLSRDSRRSSCTLTWTASSCLLAFAHGHISVVRLTVIT